MDRLLVPNMYITKKKDEVIWNSSCLKVPKRSSYYDNLVSIPNRKNRSQQNNNFTAINRAAELGTLSRVSFEIFDYFLKQ